MQARLSFRQGEPGTIIQATVFDLKTQNALLTDISDSLYVSLSGNWNDSQRYVASV